MKTHRLPRTLGAFLVAAGFVLLSTVFIPTSTAVAKVYDTTPYYCTPAWYPPFGGLYCNTPEERNRIRAEVDAGTHSCVMILTPDFNGDGLPDRLPDERRCNVIFHETPYYFIDGYRHTYYNIYGMKVGEAFLHPDEQCAWEHGGVSCPVP